MNNHLNENQVINNISSSDDIVPSNGRILTNDQNNQDIYKNWCEEDGDFEVDESVQQDDHHEIQSPQPTQLELVRDDGNFDFDKEMIDSGQSNNDQTTTTTNNNVLGGQKQNDEEEVGALQSSSTTKNNQDLDDMMTDEIGKINNGNLSAAQNNEVPVQSVLIDLKDVVTLEDEIIKSQSPEKVQKSKQSPQKGKQKKSAKKTKVDTEIIVSAENSKSIPIKSKNDQGDQVDLSASENDSKTKSGRKVQRPKFFNHTVFKYGRRKPSFDPSDSLKKTHHRKLSSKRQSKSAKNKVKDTNVSQENENGSSEKRSKPLVQLYTTNGSILYDPKHPSAIYVDPEDDNMLCVACHDGTSEKQNWIVLCDKCDVPYHQQCHKPRIEDSVAEDTQSEWICSKCKNLPRSSKRIKVDQEIYEDNGDKEPNQELISIGAVLTREQKVEYLSSLSIDVLVNLLLLAEQIEPNIPLYPANILGKYATTNMPSKDNETDEADQSIQDKRECLAVDVPMSGLSTTELSNLSTLDTSPNLNPVNIENVENVEKEPSNIPEQDSQQEPITPESSPPSASLKEIAEHNKDTYLNLYIRAMSEIGNPNGSTAQTMHSWIKSNYNVPENFSARAKKALHYAVNNGIFVKNSRMTYKFNPEYTFSYNKTANNESTTANAAKGAEMDVNNNNTNYGQKSNYKELTTGLRGGEEISGAGKHNSPSEMKDFNFYPNQDFYLDSMLDANFLGKSDDAYTATTTSQRSSLSNVDNNNNNNNNNTNNNIENNNSNNVPVTGTYNQTLSSSDKQQQSPQSPPISRIPKLSVNTQMNNEQPRTDIRLPPLAPKPPINVLPSIMRSNSISYPPSQHQNELLTCSIGGGVIRGGNQLPQQPQVYDTKVRTPSSIPLLQPLPAIDTSLNGNVGKVRTQQLIPVQSSTMHNTATTIPASPQQTWPTSFNPFYMSPQPGETQFTTIFDNTFYDPTQSPQQQHHSSSAASTNDYSNVVINDLQQHNDNNSLFHRIGGNQQQDNNIIGEWEYRNV